MVRVVLNKLTDGIPKDPREPAVSKTAYIQNFDIISYPHVLKPFNGMIANQTLNFGLTDFLYGIFGSGIGTNILAYGRQTGADRPEIYMKTGDIVTSGWTTALTATGAGTQTRSSGSNLWWLYKGYAYFASGNRYIGRVGDLANGTAATLVDTFFDLTSFTTVTQGFTHPKDDRMYFGVDNKVYYKDGGGTITLGLTLPSYLTVTSITNYGNYLAIACRTTAIIGSSIVYIWDRDTSLTTLTESIDWGNGELNVLENVDGELIGVSFMGRTSFSLSPRIIIKRYNGGTPQFVAEMISESSASLFLKKYKSGNNLYFGAKLTLNGSARACLFVIGKKDDGTWVLAGDVNVNNDTALTGNIEGFVKFEDIWFIAFNGDGSVNRTISDGSYSGTSIIETLINPNMIIEDRHIDKQLKSVAFSYKKLSSTGQVLVKVKTDGGSYETLFTETTDDAVNTVVVANSSGDSLPRGREFEFRIESSGGAVVTEGSYEYEKLTDQANG